MRWRQEWLRLCLQVCHRVRAAVAAVLVAAYPGETKGLISGGWCALGQRDENRMVLSRWGCDRHDHRHPRALPQLVREEELKERVQQWRALRVPVQLQRLQEAKNPF